MENIENVAGRIGGIKKRLRCLSDEIWNHPELAYKEYFAVGEAKKFLTEQGFRVENPCCGIETAFRAEYGTGKPAFAIFAASVTRRPSCTVAAKLSMTAILQSG